MVTQKWPGHSIVLVIFTLLILSYMSAQQPLYKDLEQKFSPKIKTYFADKVSGEFMTNYDVLHYRINLRILPEEEIVFGETTIILKMLESAIDSIYFHFSGFTIDSILVSDSALLFTRESDLLQIKLTGTYTNGDTIPLTIYYRGTPEKGLYFDVNNYETMVIYSHNEPYDAHYWFPCKDVPSDKAQLELIVTLPEEYHVLSNGVLINEELWRSQFKTTYWQENYPIATYLISIAAAPYKIVEKNYTWQQMSMPLQYYVYDQDQEKAMTAIESTEEMLDFFNNYIDVYPFILDKYAMAEVPFKYAGAMENQTATTMLDAIMDNENVIAHELAHQWWGDALTPFSFIDIWLNEGFATYFDALFVEYKYGKESFKNRLDMYYTLLSDDASLDYPIYAPPENYLFGRAVYYKGAWILHMLRNIVGDETFREICQAYYKRYRYTTDTTDKFIHICDSVSVNLSGYFFNQWLNYGGIPVLHAAWEQEGKDLRITIDQKQNEVTYQFDLEVLIKSSLHDSLIIISMSSKQESVNIMFSEIVSSIVIDPDKKILSKNEIELKIPKKSKLLGIYPNPSKKDVTISYQLDQIQEIEIEIWNLLGQKVATVFKGKENAGYLRKEWKNNKVSSGTYYCLLRSPDSIDALQMIILK